MIEITRHANLMISGETEIVFRDDDEIIKWNYVAIENAGTSDMAIAFESGKSTADADAWVVHAGGSISVPMSGKTKVYVTGVGMAQIYGYDDPNERPFKSAAKGGEGSSGTKYIVVNQPPTVGEPNTIYIRRNDNSYVYEPESMGWVELPENYEERVTDKTIFKDSTGKYITFTLTTDKCTITAFNADGTIAKSTIEAIGNQKAFWTGNMLGYNGQTGIFNLRVTLGWSMNIEAYTITGGGWMAMANYPKLLSQLTYDNDHMTVSSSEKTAWNGKTKVEVSAFAGTTSSANGHISLVVKPSICDVIGVVFDNHTLYGNPFENTNADVWGALLKSATTGQVVASGTAYSGRVYFIRK